MVGSPRLAIGLGVILCVVACVSAADVAPPAERLIVFLPEGVDWITLPLEGAELTATRVEFARRTFESRDLDQSGVLEGDEARRLPMWSPEQNRLRLLGDAWKSADTSPDDGTLTLSEWQTLVVQAFGPPLRIVVDQRGAKRDEMLFTLVDHNHDGQLNAGELEQGAARLMQCDFDDDELITLSEVAELRLVAAESQSGAFETEPFLLLQGEDSIAMALREIESRFRPSGATGVPVQRLAGIGADSDTNSDGVLDSFELTQLLKSPPTTGQLRFTWNGSKSGIRWLAAGSDAQTLLSARRRDPVELAGLEFEIRYLNASVLEQTRREELLTQFGGADRDNNEYLSAAEFAEFVSVLGENLSPDPALADVNDNQQITREEVTLFNDLRELASRCQLQLTVQREMKSLFEALDQDHNRGLSGWEIHSGSERMAALDRNRDGGLAITELSGGLSLLVGFASTRRTETLMTPVRNRNPKLPRKSGTGGAIWFQRMDRNQDQRVSWREFLGTREQFETLDQNRDGSIAVAEAP